jgi:hypothetical protein
MKLAQLARVFEHVLSAWDNLVVDFAQKKAALKATSKDHTTKETALPTPMILVLV